MYRLSALISLFFLSINIVDAQVAKPATTKPNITQQPTKPVTTANNNTQVRQQPVITRPVQTTTAPTVVRQTNSLGNNTVQQPVRSTQTNTPSTRQTSTQVPYAYPATQQANRTPQTTTSSYGSNTNQQQTRQTTNSTTQVNQVNKPQQSNTLSVPLRQTNTQVPYVNPALQQTNKTTNASQRQITTVNNNIGVNTSQQAPTTQTRQISTPVTNPYTPVQQSTRPVQLSTPVNQWTTTVNQPSKPVQLSTPTKQTSTPVVLSTPVKQMSTPVANASTSIKLMSKPVELSTPVQLSTPTKQMATQVKQMSAPVTNTFTPIKQISKPVELSTPKQLSTPVKQLSNPTSNAYTSVSQMSKPVELSKPKQLTTLVKQISTPVAVSTPVKQQSVSTVMSKPIQQPTTTTHSSSPIAQGSTPIKQLSTPVIDNQQIKANNAGSSTQTTSSTLNKPNSLSTAIKITSKEFIGPNGPVSITGNVLKGMGNGVVEDVKSIPSTIKSIPSTIKSIAYTLASPKTYYDLSYTYNPLANPKVYANIGTSAISTGKVIYTSVPKAYSAFINADADQKGYMLGHASEKIAPWLVGAGEVKVATEAIKITETGETLNKIAAVDKGISGITNVIPEGNLANHLFKGIDKLPDNLINRKLITEISNGTPLGVDAYGKNWFAKTLSDGTQIYTYTQNGIVKGAGINQTWVDIVAKYGLK